MTITGIIAEFNPFHNGHKYLLNQAEGLKIVAMSGNFMQRGEPAIVDKWTRAQMALENGADLVAEQGKIVFPAHLTGLLKESNRWHKSF